MIKPKKNPVTKLIGAGAKVAAKTAGKTIKINTDPTKPKGVFGPLKKKLAAADTPANRAKAKANARGLKAANKPTKASKTFIGNNEKIRPDVRRDMIVNGTKPARPNRERGGSLGTLRKQGKTGKSK